MNKRNTVLISLFAVLTGVSALIVIPVPFSPVPITLQSLFCILSGAVLGKKKGMLSQLVYVFLGVAGLPVFSRGTGGLAVLFGPTGGYIIGFVIAACICGLFTEKGLVFTGILSGFIIIFVLGCVQLKYVMQIKWSESFFLGAVPFIPGELIKIILAVGVYKRLRKAGVLAYTR
ncbi:biotin transporter BioY [Elusimicrobiota bacterium]